ncbi:uncharacterized protein BCR38DRAFT_200417 [Pseudomassariella vexata]|uniref:Uncharacterized protein n=1 Tax=Pseudomassariella vexata TaxID=1141098 RepID=A0A1Y2E1W4_9PEZI|nr:uncharacterized protein BCR38DRAFT_200417 [Pseudomassariella vexata]ORY65541.1 hypothetical protein BCR38DRAFT_200417 [Pseudomassariella vexata]
MDVTALLNASSAAHRQAQGSVDQTPTPSVADGSITCSSTVRTPSPEKALSRRTSESRTPNRSRTPWDAGGYSLPLTLDTKATQASARPAFYNDSPVGSASPKSPRHKFSDSHSSLSSYTSSSNSAVHSRFSSLSTVSGFHTMPTVITDVSALDSRCCDNIDSAISRTSMPDLPKRRKDGVVSPTTIVEEPTMLGSRRPDSPSDAMLISRGAQGLDQMSPQETANPRDLKNDLNYLIPPELSKTHKRAVSAPDFAALGAIDQTYPPLPSTLQPTPPPSQQDDRRSSYVMDANLASSPVDDGLPALDESIKCMYVDNCDTGSQPRKAISHIFGRNKLCTRMIPQHVWVHFCRKHYQRSRYRNAQEYAKLQCELVQKQVRRVQAWSDENKRNNQAGVVQDWSLSIRKREQKRLDDRNSSGKKRPYRDESEDDEEALDRAVLNGTAVPAWLLSKCGNGYSTETIEAIVAQLKSEMDSNNLTQIPDIEILPNISTEQEDGKKKLVLPRKNSSGGSHKRSQSVGVARNEPISMMRRVSQPNFTAGWRPEDAMHSSPMDKRQRITEFSPYGDRQGAMRQATERPGMRTIHRLPHRPAFGNIRENQTEESYFDDEDARGSHYNFGGPLPAPTPQRLASQPMAVQLDPTSTPQGYMDMRRPMHQRAHSEMAPYHNTNFTFRPSSSSGYSQLPTSSSGYPPVPSSSSTYPSVPQPYSTEAMPYDTAYMRTDPTFGAGGPPGYYDESPLQRQYAAPQPVQQLWQTQPSASPTPYGQPRHMRHQNTPGPQQIVPRMSPVEQDLRQQAPFETQPTYHRRQPSYAPTTRQMAYRPVEESEQGKTLYSERR